MNKKKILIILEFLFIIIVCKIIYDGIIIPLILKSDNSFTEFFSNNIGNLIGWIIVAGIISTIYEVLIKPLIKKIISSK